MNSPKVTLSPPSLADIPRPTLSDRLEAQFDAAADAGDPDKADGWTPERIRTFLVALAANGTVEHAARVAGMSRQGAYKFRNSRKGRGFALAWSAALRLSRDRLVDLVHSRAVHGCVELIIRDGQVWGERHRFDNRLTMSVIGRLDAQIERPDYDMKTANLIAQNFEELVDLVAAGDEEGVARLAETSRETVTGSRPRFARPLANPGSGKADSSDRPWTPNPPIFGLPE